MLINHNFKPELSVEDLAELLGPQDVDLVASRSGLTAADLDMSAEARDEEKLALRLRFLIIAVAAAAPWVCAFGTYRLLFG